MSNSAMIGWTHLRIETASVCGHQLLFGLQRVVEYQALVIVHRGFEPTGLEDHKMQQQQRLKVEEVM